jgi:hypothetical protein
MCFLQFCPVLHGKIHAEGKARNARHDQQEQQ